MTPTSQCPLCGAQPAGNGDEQAAPCNSKRVNWLDVVHDTILDLSQQKRAVPADVLIGAFEEEVWAAIKIWLNLGVIGVRDGHVVWIKKGSERLELEIGPGDDEEMLIRRMLNY